MWGDSREKKMLADRNKEEPTINSYEKHREQQKQTKLGEEIGDLILSGVDSSSSGASKTKKVLKEMWENISTPRYERKK
jgi:hypothetical protein